MLNGYVQVFCTDGVLDCYFVKDTIHQILLFLIFFPL